MLTGSEDYKSTKRERKALDDNRLLLKKSSMFSFINSSSRRKDVGKKYNSVVEGLQGLYKENIRPLEDYYFYSEFFSPPIDPCDFEAKPMVLLVGQYSTGKTTFIRYLLERDYPGMRIGPEPTTDSFVAVMSGDGDRIVPGNALVADPRKQFRGLGRYGTSFLSRFVSAEMDNPVISSLSIIDTPGILSGEKQRNARGYDFAAVLGWFAERVDRIILLFDAHKLDISDEFHRCIKALGKNDHKIRIVLNKSDMVDYQQLMRVYGALMWSLGKVINTPEVARVYIGSFWDQPLQHEANRKLFEAEQLDLFEDIQSLPRNTALRKLNDLIKRARLAKIHAFILCELKKKIPTVFGRHLKKEALLNMLPEVYKIVQQEYNIPPGDFPDINEYKEKLRVFDWSKIPAMKVKAIENINNMLRNEIPKLMEIMPGDEAPEFERTVRGGAFSGLAYGPFRSSLAGGNQDRSARWSLIHDKLKYEPIFESLQPVNGQISSVAAKGEMLKSKLPNNVLGRIWALADIDRDDQLDVDEFTLVMHLIQVKLDGHDLPDKLPIHMIPPQHRKDPKPNQEASNGIANSDSN
ncbi:EH domain-containing protein 1 [Trichoplax sp. H2]|nr:EH domain-containing protein 1 [Trichoplax sp. H2]|eukprot:RDD38949.1 EH domain-containing protein 1 [Trichoplax sp. H2]